MESLQLGVETLEAQLRAERGQDGVYRCDTAAGLTFRNDIVSGPGGQQILLEDPSGNPIELFQPAAA